MFVRIQIDPTKSFTATYVHLWLFETHSYVLGRDTKSGHICQFSYVLGRGTKRPSISRNLSTFCENVCLHLNRPQKSHLGQSLYIKGSLRLNRTYWAEIEKGDKFATNRTYWVEVLKDPQLPEI